MCEPLPKRVCPPVPVPHGVSETAGSDHNMIYLTLCTWKRSAAWCRNEHTFTDFVKARLGYIDGTSSFTHLFQPLLPSGRSPPFLELLFRESLYSPCARTQPQLKFFVHRHAENGVEVLRVFFGRGRVESCTKISVTTHNSWETGRPLTYLWVSRRRARRCR